MPRLLIIAHAPLASALKAVAAHTFPDEAGALRVVDVTADMAPEQIEALARAEPPGEDDDDPDALVFADMFGATPANVAQRLCDGHRVRAVAGVNVPMLWRTLGYASRGARLDELFARALQGGAQGVLPVTSTRPQNQPIPPNGHDPDHHHHQQ